MNRRAWFLGLLLGGCATLALRADAFDSARLDELIRQYNAAKTVSVLQIDDPKHNNIHNFVSTNPAFLTAYGLVRGAPTADAPALIQWLQRHEADLPAPFTMELGSRLFDAGQTQAGFNWFIIGEARMYYDAKRCTDSTAKDAINGYIMPYQNVLGFLRAKSLAALMSEMADDLGTFRKSVYKASPLWMCSSGMKAFGVPDRKPFDAATLIQPQDQWPALKEWTYTTMMQGIEKYKSVSTDKKPQ